MSDEEEAVQISKMILATPPGVMLDKMLAAVLFEEKIEDCDLNDSGVHLAGAQHFSGNVEGRIICSRPVPHFSTEWNFTQVLLEWLTDHFPGVEIVWDCDHWLCNINTREGKRSWFRVVHTANIQSFQEAICKAALLAQITPRKLPLDIRSIVSTGVKPRRRKK